MLLISSSISIRMCVIIVHSLIINESSAVK